MEMNEETTKIKRISKQPSPIHIVIDKKQPDYLEYLK